MDREILINISFVAWTAILAFLSRKNANLGSLLLVMMIPKITDVFVISPLVQHIENSDEWASYHFIIHSINDGLMIALIKFRWLVSSYLSTKSLYRKLAIEKYIITIYSCSIIYNLLVFGEYYQFGEKYLKTREALFYDYFTPFKETLGTAETIILTVLTVQTLIFVRQLKKKGLINRLPVSRFKFPNKPEYTTSLW